ncbi:MAG: helix-turn-helix domain-containing protein [Dehalococcoidia bacterium]
MMELLTVAETAEMLKVNPMTVRRHIAAGRLSAVRVGGRVRVRKEAVEELLKPVQGTADLRPLRNPLLAPPPTEEELAQRQALIAEILALRDKMPSIAPLTSADLVHMARDDEYWYGPEC